MPSSEDEYYVMYGCQRCFLHTHCELEIVQHIATEHDEFVVINLDDEYKKKFHYKTYYNCSICCQSLNNFTDAQNHIKECQTKNQ